MSKTVVMEDLNTLKPAWYENKLYGWLVLLGLVVLLLAVRISAPSDIYDNEQVEDFGFVLDIVEHGRWLTQWTVSPSPEIVRIRPKPPLFTWLAVPGVWAVGPYEVMFKLPSIISMIGVGGLIYLMARKLTGFHGGILAASMWFANYAVYKLGYTARSDMVMAFGIALSFWTLMLMREDWIKTDETEGQSPKFWKILTFWAGVTIAMMAKGPLGYFPIPVAWFVITVDRAWGRCGLIWHILLGIGLPIGTFAAWLWPAINLGGGDLDRGNGTLWYWQINESYTERITGQGSGKDRDSAWYNPPLYFFARLAPWSFLVLILVISRRWRFGPVDHHKINNAKEDDEREGVGLISQYSIAWALFMTPLGVLPFMAMSSKRADYLLPTYIGAVIVASVLVTSLMQRKRYALGDVSGWMRIALIGLGTGLAMASMMGVLPQSVIKDVSGVFGSPLNMIALENETPLVLAIFSSGVLISGMIAAVLAWRRKFLISAMAICFSVVFAMGVYGHRYDRASVTWAGEEQKKIGRLALNAQAELSTLNAAEPPIIFYDTNYTATQMMMGYNEWPVNESQFQKIKPGQPFIVITSGLVYANYQADPFGIRSTEQVMVNLDNYQASEVLEARVRLAPLPSGYTYHVLYETSRMVDYEDTQVLLIAKPVNERFLRNPGIHLQR